MSSADPQSTKGRLGLSIDWSNVADSASRLGQKRQADSAINQGMSLISELVKVDPKNIEFQGIQAAAYGTAGDVFRRFDDVTQALHYYREALSSTSRMQSADPNNVDGRLRLAAISNSVGEMLTRSGELRGASEMLNKALEMAKPEATSSHLNEQLWSNGSLGTNRRSPPGQLLLSVRSVLRGPRGRKPACSAKSSASARLAKRRTVALHHQPPPAHRIKNVEPIPSSNCFTSTLLV